MRFLDSLRSLGMTGNGAPLGMTGNGAPLGMTGNGAPLGMTCHSRMRREKLLSAANLIARSFTL